MGLEMLQHRLMAPSLIILSLEIIMKRENHLVREAFNKNDKTYGKFHILGGGQRRVIFHMLS